jgi:hypothetical protein
VPGRKRIAARFTITVGARRDRLSAPPQRPRVGCSTAALRDRGFAADDWLVIALARKSKAPAPRPSAGSTRGLRRLPVRAALALAGTLIALLLMAVPAGAIVVKVAPTEVGLQPRVTSFYLDGQLGASFANTSGNPVVHSNSTYTIFWDPTNSYDSDWQHLINGFLERVGGASRELANVFAVDEQYTDRSNEPLSNHSVFKGSYTDTDAYPTSSACEDPHPLLLADRVQINKIPTAVCVTDKQIQEELKKFIAQHSKLTTGMGTIYYVLTPPGVAVCLDKGGPTGHCSDYTGTSAEESYENSFCSYHGAINPGGLATGDANTVLYAAIPWTAGGLGNPNLLPADRTPGYDCQDGGWDQTTHPPEVEKVPEETATEKKEFEEATKKEKEAKEKLKALQGRHQQEPNQGECPSQDGGCDKGLADLIIGQVAIEQQNVVTNPLLNAWQDSAHFEATDECRNFFQPIIGGAVGALAESAAGTLYNQELGEGIYYLQTAFNLAAFTFHYPGVPCIPGLELEPQFTSPNPVNAGELVGFDGMESTITLNAGTKYTASGEPSPTYPTYTWNFGDGSPTVSGFAPGAPSQNSPETFPCEAPWQPPCAASAFHSYQYGGTYQVTLTVKDVGGNVASIMREVTVDGPGPPAPPAPPAPSPNTTPGSGPSSPNNPTTPPTGPTPVAPQPKVVATQAATSHSLASVLRSGLVVRYSVSSQVAGRFEVLLASSLAKKIGLKGPAATGLAKGTPAQIVIAKAILITTKGGHSSYKIKLSKATAAKLRKLRKVSLMVRMVVHNPSSPVPTTVLSTVNLAG